MQIMLLGGNLILKEGGSQIGNVALCRGLDPTHIVDQSEEYGQCTHKIKSKVRYVHA